MVTLVEGYEPRVESGRMHRAGVRRAECVRRQDSGESRPEGVTGSRRQSERPVWRRERRPEKIHSESSYSPHRIIKKVIHTVSGCVAGGGNGKRKEAAAP